MQVSAVECGPYDYSRSGNPTRAQLEAHMADLEVPCLVPVSSLWCCSMERITLHTSSCHPLSPGTVADNHCHRLPARKPACPSGHLPSTCQVGPFLGHHRVAFLHPVLAAV